MYRIRARETTGRIARFNQGGSVVTLLALQNRSDGPLVAHVVDPASGTSFDTPLTTRER